MLSYSHIESGIPLQAQEYRGNSNDLTGEYSRIIPLYSNALWKHLPLLPLLPTLQMINKTLSASVNNFFFFISTPASVHNCECVILSWKYTKLRHFLRRIKAMTTEYHTTASTSWNYLKSVAPKIRFCILDFKALYKHHCIKIRQPILLNKQSYIVLHRQSNNTIQHHFESPLKSDRGLNQLLMIYDTRLAK